MFKKCLGFLQMYVICYYWSCFSDSSTLPTPLNTSMHSVNMKHILKWSPLHASCSTVNYSVQFQGYAYFSVFFYLLLLREYFLKMHCVQYMSAFYVMIHNKYQTKITMKSSHDQYGHKLPINVFLCLLSYW